MSEPTSPPENNDRAESDAQAAADEGKSLDQLLAEAQAKIDEQRNAWLRALADAENARKRAQADIAQARRFAVERIVEDLLPVADSLEAALAAPAAEDDALRSGVELTLKLLRNALECAGGCVAAHYNVAQLDDTRHRGR